MNQQLLYPPFYRKIAPCSSREPPSQSDYAFSQTWLPTVQEVLQADWQEAGHSPQPPVLRVFFSISLFTVLILFSISQSPYPGISFIVHFFS